MNVVEAIRADAAAVLRDGRAKLVIGYRRLGERRVPAMVADAADVTSLVFDEQCRQNLAAFLRKPEVRQQFPVAVVASPAAMRSLVVLAAESQIENASVLVLAVDGEQSLGVLDVAAAAALLREKYANMAPAPELLEQVGKLAAATPEQRAAFWAEQFARCTRCHACRAACPGCYCNRCVAEKNTPQWISTAAASHGVFAWNMIRAFHQTGRCTLCGACQAACPQGLPLMLLNVGIDQGVQQEFGFRPGYDEQAKPLIGSWKPEDDDSFMR